MKDEEVPEPIVVSANGEAVQISYDDVCVEFQPDTPQPDGVPPLAQRIFEAYRYDLQPPERAE